MVVNHSTDKFQNPDSFLWYYQVFSNFSLEGSFWSQSISQSLEKTDFALEIPISDEHQVLVFIFNSVLTFLNGFWR